MSSPFPGQGPGQQPSWASAPHGAPDPQQPPLPTPAMPAMVYQQPGMPVAGYQQHVVPRNPVLYALASLLLAGLGTALCGRVGTGFVIFCTVFFTALLMFIPFIGLLFVPLWMAAWFLSVYHGFRSAKQWNARHGIIS